MVYVPVIEENIAAQSEDLSESADRRTGTIHMQSVDDRNAFCDE